MPKEQSQRQGRQMKKSNFKQETCLLASIPILAAGSVNTPTLQPKSTKTISGNLVCNSYIAAIFSGSQAPLF